jgi:hypothetical protein
MKRLFDCPGSSNGMGNGRVSGNEQAPELPRHVSVHLDDVPKREPPVMSYAPALERIRIAQRELTATSEERSAL